MTWLYLTLMLFAVTNANGDGCSKDDKQCQPEQIHISYTDKPTRMSITWSTIKDTSDTIAQYHRADSDSSTSSHQVEGTRTLFTDGGELKLNQTIHRVFLDLSPNTTYKYCIGSKYGMSEWYNITTISEGHDWEVHTLIFGDLGLENGVSTPFLINDASQHHYDMAFHVGDLAYDMDKDNGERGNNFMKSVQPLAANLPYMVCPGNHEAAYNFSHFRKRFTMPLWESYESYFYSFNLGPVHFISINTEAYYDDDKPFPHPMLKEPQKRPWIVILGHRPMYCNTEFDMCKEWNYTQRVGFDNGSYGLEVLLMKYKVDVAIWAHEHSYERMWPLYQDKVYNGSMDHPYTNPGAPVHFTSGSAGNKERQSDFFDAAHIRDWSAFRNTDYGYTRLHAYNNTHLHIEQISVKPPPRTTRYMDVKVIDEFWVIKDPVFGYSKP